MPLEADSRREAFFSDASLDRELPAVNAEFWQSLVEHIVRDRQQPSRAILDIGCHSGGLLSELERRFTPSALYGIDPLVSARAEAAVRLRHVAANVTLLDPAEWLDVPSSSIDLVTSHEVLYLVANLPEFMQHVRRVLAPAGTAYVVLGCHSENPLWPLWKEQLVKGGVRVYDHRPLDIMEAAAASGFTPAVQPLRHAGWITYNPLRATFQYPDIRKMFDHHYRFKLLFRLSMNDERALPA